MLTIKDLLVMPKESVIDTILETRKDFPIIEGPNFWIINPDGKIFLSAHVDTVGDDEQDFNLVEKNKIIWNQSGILGADDRAGVFIMLELLKMDIRDFCFGFFDLEESGCRGSKEFAAIWDNWEFWGCFVGLDRRGVADCATYGYDNEELIQAFEIFGFSQAVGSVTDVAILSRASGIACVNLSVGFCNEHTSKERLFVPAMERTLQTLLDDDLIEFLSSKRFEAKTQLNWWFGVDNYKVNNYKYNKDWTSNNWKDRDWKDEDWKDNWEDRDWKDDDWEDNWEDRDWKDDDWEDNWEDEDY